MEQEILFVVRTVQILINVESILGYRIEGIFWVSSKSSLSDFTLDTF